MSRLPPSASSSLPCPTLPPPGCAQMDKFIKMAKVELVHLDVEIKLMAKDLEKFDLAAPKRLRFAVRQMAGAPLNNPNVVQLVYSQAYAFCVRGYYALDLKTIPLLGALHLQITRGDHDKDVLYKRPDRSDGYLREELQEWQGARLVDKSVRWNSKTTIIDKDTEPDADTRLFAAFCRSFEVSGWVRVFRSAWAPMVGYNPTKARRHFLDMCMRKCAYTHFGISLWPAMWHPAYHDPAAAELPTTSSEVVSRGPGLEGGGLPRSQSEPRPTAAAGVSEAVAMERVGEEAEAVEIEPAAIGDSSTDRHSRQPATPLWPHHCDPLPACPMAERVLNVPAVRGR